MARFEDFWEVACDYRQFMWLGLMVLFFFVILTVLSLLLADPGSGSQFLAIINFGLIVSLGGVLGAMYWICLRRRTETY